FTVPLSRSEACSAMQRTSPGPTRPSSRDSRACGRSRVVSSESRRDEQRYVGAEREPEPHVERLRARVLVAEMKERLLAAVEDRVRQQRDQPPRVAAAEIIGMRADRADLAMALAMHALAGHR